MTDVTTDALAADAPAALVPSILLAPTGQHTRYMLAAYLRHVFIVTGGLLAIALTIDLWPQLSMIEASVPGSGPFGTVWAILRFTILRAPDLIIPFLPFATFLGVLWTEIVLTTSRERMLVWNSGRSPLQCLTPVLALGIILGLLDFTMDAFLRPAFMGVQMEEHLGTRGVLFDRSRTADSNWIALDRGRDGLVRARIVFGPPVVLRDIAYYKFDDQSRLQEIDSAAFATPLPDGDLWQLHNGLLWRANAPAPGGSGVQFTFATAAEAQTPFLKRIIPLNIDRLWLADYGIYAHYLPLSHLISLAESSSPAFSSDVYKTRLQVKLSELFLPGEMAVLAASLAMLQLGYTISARAIIGTLLAGYLAHFGTKATVLMGENHYMNAYVAGWLVPIALGFAAWSVLRQIQKRRVPEGVWAYASTSEDEQTLPEDDAIAVHAAERAKQA